MKLKFNFDMKIKRCDVCGKRNVLGYFNQSVFGGYSFHYCKKCYKEGREPYNIMVAYIESAGRYPGGIREEDLAEVKRQLVLHNKTEAQFKEDLELFASTYEGDDSWG